MDNETQKVQTLNVPWYFYLIWTSMLFSSIINLFGDRNMVWKISSLVPGLGFFFLLVFCLKNRVVLSFLNNELIICDYWSGMRKVPVAEIEKVILEDKPFKPSPVKLTHSRVIRFGDWRYDFANLRQFFHTTGIPVEG